MAGHSKWANIRHKKGAQDAKRGKVFTKLAKEIMVAAKLGGSDENNNPRLKSAIVKARGANMPKDNIERAIKKGSGETEGITFEEIVYEGYGSDGIAIIVEVMTDKKSRTLPEIKNIFSKAGGSMAETGAVSYLFLRKGIIIIEGDSIDEDTLLELALEAGASDLESEDDAFIVSTERASFHEVLKALMPSIEENNWQVVESGLKFIASVEIELDNEKSIKNYKLIENLESHDDVQNVYSNLTHGAWVDDLAL